MFNIILDIWEYGCSTPTLHEIAHARQGSAIRRVWWHTVPYIVVLELWTLNPGMN